MNRLHLLPAEEVVILQAPETLLRLGENSGMDLIDFINKLCKDFEITESELYAEWEQQYRAQAEAMLSCP